MRAGWHGFAALMAYGLAAAPALGFGILGPEQDVATASRWTAASGLADGLQVSVDASFASYWSETTSDPVVVAGWVEHAFAAWESPALAFDVAFGWVADADIVLRALPGPDPLGGYFGFTYVDWSWSDARVLTNGDVVPGWQIDSVQIDIAAERLQAVDGFATLPLATQGRIITRLFMHEIGHAIGLHHTNDESLAYFDTDTDPDNALEIDPADPFANLIESPNRFVGTVMSTRPCGEYLALCNALIDTTLSLDDRGGRDVLYPALVPEPGLAALLAVALLAAALRARGA